MSFKRRSSAETAAKFLEMYEPSPRVRKYRRQAATLSASEPPERCTSCGQSEFRDAVDNFGNRYRGCARCVIAVDRIKLDMARVTVQECLDCVSARINDCFARGVAPDHITNIAWQMLNDALTGGDRG